MLASFTRMRTSFLCLGLLGLLQNRRRLSYICSTLRFRSKYMKMEGVSNAMDCWSRHRMLPLPYSYVRILSVRLSHSVCFRVYVTASPSGHCSPDRVAAIAAAEELKALFPCHEWRLVCVDASYEDVVQQTEAVWRVMQVRNERQRVVIDAESLETGCEFIGEMTHWR